MENTSGPPSETMISGKGAVHQREEFRFFWKPSRSFSAWIIVDASTGENVPSFPFVPRPRVDGICSPLPNHPNRTNRDRFSPILPRFGGSAVATSEELTTRIRQDDESALAEYIELHRPQLLAFIDRNMSEALRRKVEPGDILSETAVSALAGLKDIDLSEREPFSWLCQLAERRIIDAFRHYIGAQKRSAKKEVPLQNRGGTGGDGEGGGFVDLLVASMTSPSAAFSRGQKEYKLQMALTQLPEAHREAIRLRYIEGRPTKEIAEVLGKNDGAVRVMLTRILDRLQKILRDEAVFESYLSPDPDPPE